MNDSSHSALDFSNSNKELLIKKLLETTSKLQRKFQAEDDEEKQWMIQNCKNPIVVDLLNEMTMMMLHVLDAIGRLEPVNGITISKQFGIPKGSVSKITRKLVEKQIIQTEFLPDNKKEILFRTTSLGKEMFYLHEALHRQIKMGVQQFLQRYDTNQLRFLIHSLEDTLNASWVNLEVQQESIESTSALNKEHSPSLESNDMDEIIKMLHTLDNSSLKKAKVILKDVFFTSYDE
ncbi:winged helix DNA-binding protein [Robertmurraya sp. Marseille-Q9965]